MRREEEKRTQETQGKTERIGRSRGQLELDGQRAEHTQTAVLSGTGGPGVSHEGCLEHSKETQKVAKRQGESRHTDYSIQERVDL